MLDQMVITFSIVAFIAGIVAAAIFPMYSLVAPTVAKPSPMALPATQTADISARAGADPSGS